VSRLVKAPGQVRADVFAKLDALLPSALHRAFNGEF
jgi:hypothetical protein